MGSYGLSRLCRALSLVLAASSLTLGAQAFGDRGQWTPAVDWSYSIPAGSDTAVAYAIHLALLPGDDQPYHSRIVWWNGHKSPGFAGREMGWLPGNDGCGSFPSSSFEYIGAAGTPGSQLDVFCSGHAGLADGRLFVPGGTSLVTGIYGENKTRIFQAGTGTSQGSWSDPGSMKQWRWYPTATTLRDGRVLVTSGSRHRQIRMFGGFRNGVAPPTADTVFRFGQVEDGAWEPPVRPDADGGSRPDAREGHIGLEMKGFTGFDDAQVFFGGRQVDGSLLDDLWLLKRLNNVAGADYGYQWDQVSPTPTPGARAEHSAVAVPHGSMLVVFAGLNGSDQGRNDVWRLKRVGANLAWKAIVITNPGAAPSVRFGHTAVYDTTTVSGQLRQRMIVFGGTSALGQAPSDANVYELRFDPQKPDTATWYTMTQTGTRFPPPTYRHTLTTLPGQHLHQMYGGIRSDGSFDGDSLWRLWTRADGTVDWTREYFPPEIAGQMPGPRARHTAVFDPNIARLQIYGGETSTGPADSYVYSLHFSSEWERWGSAGFTLKGHSAVVEADVTMARWPDLYDPIGATEQDRFKIYESIGLLQDTYPPTFVIPGGTSDSCRVISVASDLNTYQLNVPKAPGAPGPWRQLVNGSLGFVTTTGVSYRPGRLMITENLGGGATKTLDTGNLSNSWASAGTMVPRARQNLVLLPNGEVLVVGGVRVPGLDGVTAADAVRRPQIWNPASGSWSDTTSSSRLPVLNLMRNYHSTAILMPDGRILTGGGDRVHDLDGNGIPDYKTFNLFCPPYLYKADGTTLAQRRTIQGSPAALDWRKTFTICVDDTTGIRKVVLIRAPATTHTFDENQRYVPLDFTVASNPARLLATAPSSPDSAPPGYYLLFVVGSKDGSEMVPDVPSIARWVRLGPAGRDTCDAVRPETMFFGIDAVTQTTAYLSWTETADDTNLAVSGPVKELDLRRRSSSITSESAWTSATQLTGEPTPGTPGNAQYHTVTGLTANTTYHFALRAKDDNYPSTPLSGLHASVWATTSGGGGGMRAQTVSENSGDGRGAISMTMDDRGVQGDIVVLTDRRPDAGWQVRITRTPPSDDGGGITMGRVVDGAWKVERTLTPGPSEDGLGLCRWIDGGRTVLHRDFQLEQIASSMDCGSRLTLASAWHSESGDVAIQQLGQTALGAGDTLTLKYAPGVEANGTGGWFLLARRVEGTSASRMRRPEEVPTRDALHAVRPNPTRGSSELRFDLAESGHALVEILDLQGRHVRTLVDGLTASGRHVVQWDGRAEHGGLVSPGIYVCQFKTGDFKSLRKLAVLR